MAVVLKFFILDPNEMSYIHLFYFYFLLLFEVRTLVHMPTDGQITCPFYIVFLHRVKGPSTSLSSFGLALVQHRFEHRETFDDRLSLEELLSVLWTFVVSFGSQRKKG